MASKKNVTTVIDLSPTEQAARIAAGIALDVPLSEQEIAARENEKANLLAQHGAKRIDAPAPLTAVEVKPNTTVASIIAKLANAARTSDAAVTVEKHAQIEAEARPQIAEARGLLVRHGLLKSKHLTRVATAALADWNAVRLATPANLTPVADRGLVSLAHEAIGRLEQAARTAYDVLISEFGDSNTSGRDVDPQSLPAIATAVENMLDGRDLFDPATGLVRQTFRRAVSHLTWRLEKGRALVAATEDSVTRFEAAVAHFETTMADVTPADGVTIPKAATIPQAAKDETFVQRFAAPFDPREGIELREPDNVTVTKVAGGTRIVSTKERGA